MPAQPFFFQAASRALPGSGPHASRRAVGCHAVAYRQGALFVSASLLLLSGCANEPPPAATSLQDTDSDVTITPAPSRPVPDEPPSLVVLPGPDLSASSRGSRVLALERALAALGYAPGQIDRFFTAATSAAVAAFQSQHGLKPDGIAGHDTIAAINQELQY